MPTPASTQSTSLFARVQRWLGLDDADDASECPCAVAARIERAAAEARAKRLAGKDSAMQRKLATQSVEAQSGGACSIAAAREAIAAKTEAIRSARADDGKADRAATYAMGGYFHSGFLADTFVYLPEVWLGGDGEH
jgi:hypothetical protein